MDGQQDQCNITDASPHLTTGLLHLDLYSDLESRFGPMQPRKPAQDTLSHTFLCHGVSCLFSSVTNEKEAKTHCVHCVYKYVGL